MLYLRFKKLDVNSLLRHHLLLLWTDKHNRFWTIRKHSVYNDVFFIHSELLYLVT